MSEYSPFTAVRAQLSEVLDFERIVGSLHRQSRSLPHLSYPHRVLAHKAPALATITTDEVLAEVAGMLSTHLALTDQTTYRRGNIYVSEVLPPSGWRHAWTIVFDKRP